MRAIERTTRAELRELGVSLGSSVGARAAVDLARRMDAEPGDRSAVMLSRELRLLMADLRSQVKGDATGDVEAFLARIAAPDVGHAAH
jgi:hypothetical protein